MPDERGGDFAERPLIRWLRSQFGPEWLTATESTVLFEVEQRLREQTLRLTPGAFDRSAGEGGRPIRRGGPGARVANAGSVRLLRPPTRSQGKPELPGDAVVFPVVAGPTPEGAMFPIEIDGIDGA